jgi:large subunit ribosomal protein L13
MIINGEGLILGRVSTHVAKTALLGENVALVNCSKIIISGSKRSILEKQRSLSKRSSKPNKGIFYERRPDYFVLRCIRRMLPQSARGVAALSRIRCYTKIPGSLKDKKLETVGHAHSKKLPNLKYMSVGTICTQMGGQWQQR